MSAELLNYIIVNIDSNDSVIVNNDNNMVSSNMASSNMANNNMASSNMVNNNITSNDKIISKILEICWRQIEDETDIAHSKASFLVLIKNIYTIHNRSLPSDISSLYPCFTSPVKIIRDSVVDLCRIFKNEESLYLLGESILLADDTEQARRTCEVLAECVENTEKFEGLSDFFSHFFRIISLNIYAPYKEDDFACFNDNFFTKDGIQSIGYDFILRNRLFLFKILEKIENRNVLEVKTVLGLTFTGLLEYKLSSSLSSKLQGNILQDCSLQSNYKDLQGNCVLSMELQGNDNSKGNYKDLQGNDKDNGKNNGNNDKDKDRDLRTHLLNNIQSDFNRYPFLKRMSIDEFKSIISNPSYKSLLLLANERTVDYVRMIVTNNLNIPDISIYYQLETSIEALRLITKYKISIGIDSLLIKNMYNLLVEEAIKISENEELNNCKTKNNYENNLSRPLENYCIFFEELGSLIFNENIIDFIMNDKNRLIFFELTIRYYITDNIIENDVLNILFNQALAIGNIQILKYFIRNLHYNQLLVKNLLIDFKPAVFYELLDYSDPSFNPLFVGLALRNPFPGLLSKIIPSLYFIPNENIGNDLLQLINSKRSELSMLVDPTKIPEYSVDCNVSIELRDYQKEGIRWMAFLNKFGLNGILADDMGLGKTIQVLTYLVNEMNKCNHKDSINDKGDSIDSIKSLIICPGSLTFHWSNELKTYFNLDSQIYNNKIKTLSSNIIIATYDNIRRDTGILTNRKWFMVIFDEGHLLKSRTTQLYNKSMLLVSTYKFILTGTPIHNSVDDLFSLFNLIMPGYLGTESSFSANYMVKITEKNVDVMENRLELLHKKVLPFIMRRLKTDVLKDLPPKIIKDVSVELSQEHMEIYKNVSSGAIGGETVGEKQNISADVEKSQLNYQHLKNSGSLLLTRSMLKAASHPHHFDSTVPSSKTAVLKEILSMCGERKVLIFFQLKKTIDFVIEELGIVNYLRLDGTLPATQRGSVVSRFNSESVQYLFLTTSIGGLGLNLVSADTVIFYEHDWNPFNDLQAMDRAHRLGQKRVVNVFRLISKDTIEEKVMNYQNFKVFVASSIVTQQNTGIEKMDTKDLLERFE
ncbi:TATA-binding protein-associated factor [Pancytospora epiphaga]|nr:TATA-binding protein-associated factor [Pancytospora epiphaga]